MFLLKLFIVLLFSYMSAAQSCTVDRNQANKVYCAAIEVHRSALLLKELSLGVPVATENPVATIILSTTFQRFSSECKNFTLAMSLKHQLQNYLFTQNISTPVSNQISLLSSILINLHRVANSFDDIHSKNKSSHCVRLSEHGYRLMYHVVQYKTTPLLTEIENQGKKWVDNNNKGNGSRCCKDYLTGKWFVAK